MNCQDSRLMIHQDVDGRLAEAARSTLDAHVAACEACRAERTQSRALQAAFAADRSSMSPPAGLAARIWDGINRGDLEVAVSRPTGASLIWRRPLAAAAAVLLFAGGAFWAGHQTASAKQDALQPRLESWMQELLGQGADRAEVERLHRAYLERLEAIDSSASKERDEAYQNLSRSLERLVASENAAPEKR